MPLLEQSKIHSNDVDAGTALTGLWQVSAQKTGAEPIGPANRDDLST